MEGALLLRKFSDGNRMSFSQRFRYNEMAQRYAVYSDLWRKKNRIREEGYRRPQDALLSVQGVREAEHEPEHKVYGVSHAAAAAVASAAVAATPAAEAKPFSMQCADARAERDQVQKLYQALTDAKKRSGEAVSGNLDSFTSFVQKKTEQIRKQYGCEAVEYTGRNAKRRGETQGQSESLDISRQSSDLGRPRATVFPTSIAFPVEASENARWLADD